MMTSAPKETGMPVTFHNYRELTGGFALVEPIPGWSRLYATANAKARISGHLLSYARIGNWSMKKLGNTMILSCEGAERVQRVTRRESGMPRYRSWWLSYRLS